MTDQLMPLDRALEWADHWGAKTWQIHDQISSEAFALDTLAAAVRSLQSQLDMVSEKLKNEEGWARRRYADSVELRKERDIAQARVRELEDALAQQKPVAWCVAYDDPKMGAIHSNPTMYKPEAITTVALAVNRVRLVELYLPLTLLPDKDEERK